MADQSDTRVVTVTPDQDRNANLKEKVSVTVDAYTFWVLSKLVGVKGLTPAGVAYFILKDWIQDHIEELEHLGITVQVAEGRLTLRHSKNEL